MFARAIRRQTYRYLAIASLVLTQATITLGDVAPEAQLKAAYLVNFLKYIEWPQQQTSITICLFGRDVLGPYLATYEGRQIVNRELHIRRVSSPEQLTDCNELFVPETEEARFSAVLRWVDKQPILTVSDTEVFVRDGGAIALIHSDGRLQFDINATALNRANLKAHSQMLRLARQVSGIIR